MTNGDIVFLSNSPFFVDRILRLSFQVVLTRERAWISFRYFKTCSCFNSCKFPWSRFTILSLRNRMNSSGEFWSNCILLLGEKCWIAWRREILCGHCLKFSSVATVQVCRILRFFPDFNILTN